MSEVENYPSLATVEAAPDTCQFVCMTNKATSGTGWIVHVTTEVYGGGAPLIANYYAAIENPQDAIDAVRTYLGAGRHVLVEVKELLPADMILELSEKFGLQQGGVIPWVKI